MKKIVFTDSHIEESCLDELEKVFKEILKYTKDADVLVCVGDYYERNNPTAKEIDFGTRWAITFKQHFKRFVMVAGNHTAISKDMTSVTYLRHFGIEIVEDIVLDGTYYGHFMVKESLCGFNEKRTADSLLEKYELSILGHQHTYQVIQEGDAMIVHPGSCRYVDFGEASDRSKYLLYVEECGFNTIILSNVRPMVDVHSVKELKKLTPNYQVRVIFDDFQQFLREADELEKVKEKFFKFKTKFNFARQATITLGNSNNTTEQIVSTWLESIIEPEVQEEITREFKRVGICK